MDRFIRTLGNAIVLLFAAAMAIAATVHGIGGNAALAATCGSLCIVAFFAARLELLESLSAFGFKAKMRQIDETLIRADEVLDKLRNFAAILSKSMLDNFARVGRMGGPTVRQSWEMTREIKHQLISLKVPAEEVRNALSPWSSFLVLDIAFGIGDRFDKAILAAARSASRKGTQEERSAAERQAQLFNRERIGNPYFNSKANDYPSRLYEIAQDAPFIDDEMRSKFMSIVDDVAPIIESINNHQEIPETDLWLDHLERIRRPQFHSPDQFDWRANKLDSD